MGVGRGVLVDVKRKLKEGQSGPQSFHSEQGALPVEGRHFLQPPAPHTPPRTDCVLRLLPVPVGLRPTAFVPM